MSSIVVSVEISCKSFILILFLFPFFPSAHEIGLKFFSFGASKGEAIICVVEFLLHSLSLEGVLSI